MPAVAVAKFCVCVARWFAEDLKGLKVSVTVDSSSNSDECAVLNRQVIYESKLLAENSGADGCHWADF